MTLDQWFAENDPRRLLESCRPAAASPEPLIERRMRLFACAAVRQVWDLLTTDARSAVQVSERFANGRATRTDLLAASIPDPGQLTAAHLAQAAAYAASREDMSERVHGYAAPIADDSARNAARAFATHTAGPAPPGRPTTPEWHAAWNRAYLAARADQAEILRDIFPPPQYVLRRDAEWMTSTVVALAKEMDDSGDFSAVPILADALQDAGCDDELILTTCRTDSNLHVRGNWVVNLVLGRI